MSLLQPRACFIFCLRLILCFVLFRFILSQTPQFNFCRSKFYFMLRNGSSMRKNRRKQKLWKLNEPRNCLEWIDEKEWKKKLKKINKYTTQATYSSRVDCITITLYNIHFVSMFMTFFHSIRSNSKFHTHTQVWNNRKS